jgi:hypothetical protein
MKTGKIIQFHIFIVFCFLGFQNLLFGQVNGHFAPIIIDTSLSNSMFNDTSGTFVNVRGEIQKMEEFKSNRSLITLSDPLTEKPSRQELVPQAAGGVYKDTIDLIFFFKV